MAVNLPFADRRSAGQQLARTLAGQRDGPRGLVLALPRGGVPVAYEVAAALGFELDVLVVRKLGVPGQPELAMGAIAGNATVLNDDIVRALGIPEEAVAREVAAQRREIERRELAYRGGRPAPELAGRRVLLVDDGLATGATMRAAVAVARSAGPERLVVAVPVAPTETLAVLQREADEVVCLATPEPYLAVGRWYRNFTQTEDDEVRGLLARARGEAP